MLPDYLEMNRREVLGQGSYGIVFGATDTARGVAVAIKMVNSRKVSRRHGVESELPALLAHLGPDAQHPNLVAILGVYPDYRNGNGESDDCGLFIVMERCWPHTVKDFIDDRGCAKAPYADHVITCVVRALNVLHRAGLAHRDVSATNVSFDPKFGAVKLMDYGFVVKVPAENGGRIATGPGSPMYMPPEQLTMKEANPYAMDVWATGQLLYFMLCGRLYYQACRTVGDLRAALQQPLEMLPPTLSSFHIGLLCVLMEKDAERRVRISVLREYLDDHVAAAMAKVKEQQNMDF